jgi:cyclopropane fatty-acyl-phospholipid synthase-like methyltransferase
LDSKHSVVGIDISAKNLAYARKLYPAINYKKMAMNDMCFVNQFEGAICIEALEHVFPEEWPVVLKKFREALKPGGVLYFTVDTCTDDAYLRDSYERAKSLGLPVILGEVADEVDEAYDKVIASKGDVPGEVSDKAVYHYYPGLKLVEKWIYQEQFDIELQGTGTYTWGSDDAYEATYEHYVVRKR